MNSLWKALKRPEYFYNPRQLVRRSLQKFKGTQKEISQSRILGCDFCYRVNDDVGRAIHSFGLYDLCVSESLWRLVELGDEVVDVGANIGYFSVLLSRRVGSQGRVNSFEPNPQILDLLKENLQSRNNIELHAVALSDREQESSLFAPENYEANRGLASLNQQGSKKIATVGLKTLDSFQLRPRVMKMDVEGHELQVLKGARDTLISLEHIVFEDHDLSGNGVAEFLNSQGFEIYYLQKTFGGLKLQKGDSQFTIDANEPPNFLATRWSSEKINTLFSEQGWQFLKQLRQIL